MSVDLESGQAYGFGVRGASAAGGVVTGDSVVYRDARPAADLELQATPVGVKETIILKSADAPTTWEFPLHLDGLQARLANGAVELVNADGDVEAVIPPGFMEDSDIDPLSGDGARSHDVEYQLAGEPGNQILRVSVDQQWLADPDRAFPVRVDPTVQKDSNGSTYVQSPYTNDYSGESTLRVGTYNGGDNKSAAFLKFSKVSSDLSGMKILDAKLGLFNVWSYSCSARNVYVREITQSWSVSGNKSWPGPSYGSLVGQKSFASGYADNCGPKWHVIDFGSVGDPGIDLVQGWVRGQSNYGLRVSASSTDSYGWKKFASANSANAPYLQVTYSKWWAEYTIGDLLKAPTAAEDGKMRVTVKNDGKYTWTPTSSYRLAYRLWDTTSGKELYYPDHVARTPMTKNVATGQSITLDAGIKRLDPGKYKLRWDMLVEGEARFSSRGVPYSSAVYLTIPNQLPYVTSMSPKSGFRPDTLQPTLKVTGEDPDNYPGTALKYLFKVCDQNGANCTQSSWSTSTSWRVSAGALSWSKSYLWYARVSDGENWGPWTQGASLVPVVAQPAVTSHLGGKAGGGVDPGVGNFTTSETDAQLSVVGPDLSVTRTYNSQETRRDLVFGSGWATRWDTRLVPDNDGSDSVVVTYPNGRQSRFGKNPDGSYAAPQGRNDTLVAVAGGGWTLRTVGNIRFQFDPDGNLTKITDAVGRAQTLTYNAGGELATATDAASGRSLTFTWSGGHIQSVQTGPDPTLSWTYTYAGDLLSKVCDPEGGCTNYSYQAGTVYRTVTMDTNPKAYWRLADTGNGTATSEVPGIHGNVDGTANDVAPDASTPVANSPLGSGAFNGTSSYVKFGDNPVRGERYRSVELWFKTTGTSGGVLFSTGNFTPGDTVGTSGSMPVLYVGTDGKLYGHFCNGNVTGIVAPAAVNDGGWHHVVLSAAGDVQTLYLDGAKVGGQTADQCGSYSHAYLGAGVVTTQEWPSRPTSEWGYFNGSIAEAAAYLRPLGATTVAEHYAAREATNHLLTKITRPGGAVDAGLSYDLATERVAEHTDHNGAVWKYSAPVTAQITGDGDETLWRTTVAVTDPILEDTTYVYDPTRGGRLVEITDPEGRGGTRTFEYDTGGFLLRQTDPNGNSVELRHDERGNLISRTVPYWDGIDHTEYWSYFVNADDPMDPRNDQVTYHRNGRSSSATDDRYLIRFIHNIAGQVEQTQSPGSTGGLERITNRIYTDGTEAAVGGGTMPAGLLRQVTDPGGGRTGYSYTSAGDLASMTDPAGQQHKYGYDGVGRRTSQTTVLPSGGTATATFVYDAASRLTEARQPTVTNAVTGAEQQLLTVNTYNLDGTLASTTASDSKSTGTERTTTYGYDSFGRQNTVTDPEGGIERVTYNDFGQVWTRTDAAGTKYTHTYVPTHTGWQPGEITVHGWTGDGGDPHDVVLESRAYDPAGRLARKTDAMGNTEWYVYWLNNQRATRYLGGYRDPDTGDVGNFLLLQQAHTGTGEVYAEIRRSYERPRRTDFTFDPGGRTVKIAETDEGAVLGSTEIVYDDLDNPIDVQQKNADGSVASHTEFAYDPMGRELKRTQHLTSTTIAVTTTTRDTRGLPTAVVDPRGNVTGATAADYTTTFGYDDLGQLIETSAPPVAVESDGDAAVTKRPVAKTGYNTFGEITHSRDENGNLARIGYDQAGRPVSQTLPEYLPPGATTPIVATIKSEYDPMGRVKAQVDPVGHRTTFGYDELGNLRMTVDPSLAVSSPGGTTVTEYTPTGLPLKTTDPIGAETFATYDELGRQLTATVADRKPVLRNLTTQFRYDRLGNQTKAISPSGLVTESAYDGLGNPTKVTDPAGVQTTSAYDSQGNVLRIAHPETAVQKFSYDLAGRNTSSWEEDSAGTVLRKNDFGYDLAGNPTDSTNAEGAHTITRYDALNRVTEISRPVSDTKRIATTYGYDAAGNVTRATDGNGHVSVFTVNAWGLPESTIEPATAQHPVEADRTYTVAYEARGLVASLRKPGGVTVSNTFDPLGRLVKQSGAGAESATPDREFSYDLAGRMTRVSAPGGDNTYTYNDRGSLLSAAGPSGTTEFTWNDDGQLASSSTGAGTASYGYQQGRLATAADPLSGATVDYGYDPAGRMNAASVAGGASRTFGYDIFGRLKTDSIKKADGTQSAQVSYGYNDADQLTGKTTIGVAGAATNTYGYDDAGRLTSWNNGTSTTEYAWDDNNNLLQRGSYTGTFNERNQLIAHGSSTLTYTARGTLASVTTDGTMTNLDYNAFDELTQMDATSYRYDGLNRLLSHGTTDLTYVGLDRSIARTGGWSYSYTPGGDVLGAGNGTTSGLGWTDQHTDLIGVIDPSTAALHGSRSYDPFGNLAGTAGAQPLLGYQHQYTDPATGMTNMGSRWYGRHTGTFTSRDTAGLDPRDTLNANRYGYGAASPLNHTDPSGNIVFVIPAIPAAWAAGAQAVAWGAAALAGGYVIDRELTRYQSRTRSRSSENTRTRDRYARDSWSKRIRPTERKWTPNRPNRPPNGPNRPHVPQNPGCHVLCGSTGTTSSGTGGSVSIAAAKAAAEAARLARWARIVEQRANTSVKRPKPTETIREVTRPLWDAANDIANSIDLGVLDVQGDENNQPFRPENVNPDPSQPGSAQGYLDDACATGGRVGSDGSRSGQAWQCGQGDAKGANKSVDLASSARRNHILYGDATGGGHLWPGLPGKTPFPKGWSGDRIMHEISDIATDPSLTWRQITGRTGASLTRGGKPVRFEVIGSRGGANIKVILEPGGEGIITAHPVP